MSNPLMSMMGSQMPGPMGNFMQVMQQFNQFRSTFQGDPKAKVQELVRNGQMSQQQFEQFSRMANDFQKMMK